MILTIDDYIEKHQHTLDILKSQYADLPISSIILKMAEDHGFYSIPIECYTDEAHIIGVSLHNAKDPIRSTKAPKKVIFHNHNYFELVYVYRGECVNQFRHTSLTLQEGDLLLLNPNVLHDLYTEEESSCIFNIMLNSALFRQIANPVTPEGFLFTDFFLNYMYSLNTTQDYLLFSNLQNRSLYMVLRGVIEEHINLLPGNKNIIVSSLSLLFSLLAREYALWHTDDGDNHKKLELISAILIYIRQHCTDVTLTQLEKQFSYSAGHLSKLLLKHTGKTFKDLTTHFRLERIEDLLTHTDIPVSRLVEESGFNDLSYLNKVFKKKYGITPTQYRTMYR